MKTLHLLAVGIAGAMALGAAGGYGLSQWTQSEETTSSVPSSVVSTPAEQTSAPTPSVGNGPWNQDLMIVSGVTLDSLGEAKTFVERAGVPTVVQREDGTLLAAFQWFPEDNEEAFDNVAVSSSTDGGATWTDPEPIVIEGLPEGYQRPFDPTLVVLEDGSIRLYFTSSTEERPGPNQMTSIYAATSEDGVTYEYNGEAFSVEGERAYDAAVVYFDELWHIGTPHAPDQGMYHGTSTDGMTFTTADALSNGSKANWTGNFYTLEQIAYFFGTGTQSTGGSLWFSDSNDMTTWSSPTQLHITGGDPAAVYVQDQGWIVIYVSSQVRSESRPFAN